MPIACVSLAGTKMSKTTWNGRQDGCSELIVQLRTKFSSNGSLRSPLSQLLQLPELPPTPGVCLVVCRAHPAAGSMVTDFVAVMPLGPGTEPQDRAGDTLDPLREGAELKLH